MKKTPYPPKANEKLEPQTTGERIFLTPERLAKRWFVPLATLSQWRWTGDGPPYLKIGKRILYDLEKIERFEDKKIRTSTSQHESFFQQKGQ